MTKRLTIAVLVAIVSLLTVSCQKDDNNLISVQEGYIETISNSLVSSDTTATITRNNGSVRVTVKQGEGEPLKENGAVSFFYAAYYLTGGSISRNNLFTTNYDIFASSENWSVTDSSSFRIRTVNFSEESLIKGLQDGMVGVRGGEECFVMFSKDYGFKDIRVANIPANSALAYHLWIKSVSND